MEFRTSKKVVKNELPSKYPHALQLYLKSPDGDCNLDEFESFAFDRLKVLRILEQAKLMGHRLYSPEWKTAVIGYLKKDHLRKWANLIQNNGANTDEDVDLPMRREDHISHFTLRLVHCRDAEKRSWFIAREMELFKLRFSYLSAAGLRNFIKAHSLSYVPISQEAKDELKDQLTTSTFGFNLADIESTDFYKVDFIDVPNLVSKRMVFLKGGFAYIPSTELVSCIISQYRTDLSRDLIKYSRRLPYLHDQRVADLTFGILNNRPEKNYLNNENKDSVEVEDLERLSQTSFPLCMKSLYDTIKTTHHMKHFGRLQFGLFLKGIGLSLENAIKYWKGEFTKIMDEDKFTKNYVYNIKHSYGTIGKMTNYTPYSCMKIISSNVGPGECHGCPFKHWELDTLRRKMADIGINTDGMKDVLDTTRAGHYQIACSKYFMHTHGGQESKAMINHPNQYFEESQELHKSNSGKSFTVNKKPTKQKADLKTCPGCNTEPCACPTLSTQDAEVMMDLAADQVNWEETI